MVVILFIIVLPLIVELSEAIGFLTFTQQVIAYCGVAKSYTDFTHRLVMLFSS